MPRPLYVANVTPSVEIPDDGTPLPPLSPSAGGPALYTEYIDVMRPCTEATSAFHAAAFLVIAGILFGRKAFLQLGAKIYTNFFCVLIAPTARSRKSTALALALEYLLQQLAPDPPYFRVSRGRGSGEGWLEQVSDINEKNQHVSERRMIIAMDEFSGVLRKMRQGDRSSTIEQFLLEAADGISPMTLDTRAEALCATDALVGLLGATTRSSLERDMTNDVVESGLVNRILFFGQDAESKPKPRPPSPDPRGIYSICKGLYSAVERAPSGAITMTGRAGRRWDEWYCDFRSRSVASEQIDHATARMDKHAARIALLFALLDGRRQIDLCDIDGAIALSEYCAFVAAEVFTGTSTSMKIRTEQRIVDTIRRLRGSAVGVSKRTVQQHLSGTVSAQEFSPALDNLMKVGAVITVGGGDKGSMLLRVNE